MLDQPLRRNSAGIASAIAELVTAFGNRVVTSHAVREQHANTTTWVAGEPPDAVVYPQSADDVQQIVRICARHRAPVIAFGTGTSFEGHINAPYGGVSIDLKDMNRIIAIHPQDFDCVVEPGVTRKQLNVVGSWAFEPRHMDAALKLLDRTNWKNLFAKQVTHRFALANANEALETVSRHLSGKAVIVP